ncbi:ferredoxin family protein [Arcanobacterium buesumense]|uniref:Ferredoxin-like protein n=1 Tax=Arcanobacterium buesumense TaxID=2722751 RepID=A0A6H2EMH0_9ACTO|nr:4Fe-4S dicluster domain-containing protein [Arcanobacterium buesumense]QJC22278.1 ferredoxin [Arcanobacterium buesumense]
MTYYKPTSVTERLAGNIYEVDEGNSHIVVNQDMARATGAGKLLERVCPAHVYTEEADKSVSVEYAACLECGTCLAIAPPGLLKWHYPDSSMGVMFREG